MDNYSDCKANYTTCNDMCDKQYPNYKTEKDKCDNALGQCIGYAGSNAPILCFPSYNLCLNNLVGRDCMPSCDNQYSNCISLGGGSSLYSPSPTISNKEESFKSLSILLLLLIFVIFFISRKDKL
jgi:hypothetical protein